MFFFLIFFHFFSILLLGEYHQYDTFVYPKKAKTPKTFTENVQEKGIWKGILGYAKSVVTRSTDEFNPIISNEEMVKICLHAYLKNYQEKLCSGILTTISDVHKTVLDITHIIDSLQTCWVRKINSPRGGSERKDLQHYFLKEVR